MPPTVGLPRTKCAASPTKPGPRRIATRPLVTDNQNAYKTRLWDTQRLLVGNKRKGYHLRLDRFHEAPPLVAIRPPAAPARASPSTILPWRLSLGQILVTNAYNNSNNNKRLRGRHKYRRRGARRQRVVKNVVTGEKTAC